jgi:hypothetical protein
MKSDNNEQIEEPAQAEDSKETEERYEPDDYVHAAHQVPFSRPENTRSSVMLLAITLGIPIILLAAIAYLIVRFIF